MDLIETYLQALAVGAEKRRLPLETIRALHRAVRDASNLYRLHHDFETYCDVSITDVGSDVYSRHPSCEPLMLAYAVNDEPIAQWLPAEGEPLSAHPDLTDMLRDSNCLKFAWNKPFEWAIWRHCLDIHIPHDQWRDPMVLAYSLSLPGKLEKAGEVVGLDEDKRKLARGKALIRKFCQPRKATKANDAARLFWYDSPEEWQEFKDYNINDVEAERGIYRKIKRWNMSVDEWDTWVMDQEINQAGIPINLPMVRNAIKIYEQVIQEADTEMRQLTGLDNPNSRAQILGWLRDHGYPFEDVKAGHVKIYRDRLAARLAADKVDADMKNYVLDNATATSLSNQAPIDEDIVVERVLELRLRSAKSSPKKYYSLEESCDASDPDNVVIRNCFQFAGAGRTWRWAGRLYQAQNLPKPATKALEKDIVFVAKMLEKLSAPAILAFYPDVMDVLTTGVRPCAQAPDGYVFIDVDLNAIENRVLGWIADCRKILQVFYDKRDPYVDFSKYLFGGTYEDRWAEYKGGDSKKRTISKPGVLGCGYMLSQGHSWLNEDTGEMEADGLLGYAWNMGITEFTPEQSELSVKTFRREFEEVKDFWYDFEKAFRRTVRTGKTSEHHMLRFEDDGVFTKMILPSGRPLHYCRARVEDKMAPWGKMKPTITYEGLNEKKHWARQSTHPGKVTENADQAIARDVFAHGMKIAKREYGLDVRIHVHDQAVALVREDVAEKKMAQLKEAMSRDIWWAKGLPLGAAGTISKVFNKD